MFKVRQWHRLEVYMNFGTFVPKKLIKTNIWNDNCNESKMFNGTFLSACLLL